jgi:hypothetical protein
MFSNKIKVFWDVTACNVIYGYRRFGEFVSFQLVPLNVGADGVIPSGRRSNPTPTAAACEVCAGCLCSAGPGLGVLFRDRLQLSSGRFCILRRHHPEIIPVPEPSGKYLDHYTV